jgi:hypothetical protein
MQELMEIRKKWLISIDERTVASDMSESESGGITPPLQSPTPIAVVIVDGRW